MVLVGRPTSPVEPRPCVICGNEIPRLGRAPSDYARVRTCSLECRHELLVANGLRQSPMPHPCAVCNAPVANPRQATCGPRCRAIYVSRRTVQPLNIKRCKVCKRVIRLDAALHAPKHGPERYSYRRKQTCSHRCARTLAGRTHSDTDASVRRAIGKIAVKYGITLAQAKRLIRGR